MANCGDCKYFTPGGGKYDKGHCSYHGSYYYPDDSTCSHYSEGKGERDRYGNRLTCESCKYFSGGGRYSKGQCSYRGYSYYPDEDACSHHASDSSSGGGCFLTSACCYYKGLPDNCRELSLIRSFREELKEKPYGEQLIRLYYRDAPGIVSYIDASPERETIYQEIYETVSRIADWIEQGNKEEALMSYVLMVYELSRKALGEKGEADHE